MRHADERHAVIAKPTVEDLGIDVDAQTWLASGGPGGAIEVAFVGAAPLAGQTPDGSAGLAGQTPDGSASLAGQTPDGEGEWVLMRVADDPARRVLVYDRFEWDCFLDGVKNGEFDDAAELLADSLT
jgi:hypothetical protein